MGYGIGGYISLSLQSSGGTATTNRVYVPFKSESLTENIEQLQSENIRAIYDNPNTLEGIKNITGDIVFEPHPIYLGHFLKGVCGQVSTTFSTSAAVHEFLPSQGDFDETLALPPYTIEVYKSVGDGFRYVDAQIHTLAINMTAGAIAECTATIHARAESAVSKQTASYVSADPFTWDTVSLQVGGSANGEFESATVTITNPIVGVPTLNGAKTEGKLKRDGFRTVTVNGDQDFSNQTQSDIFKAQTRQRFLFTLTGGDIGGSKNNQLTIDMPQTNYTTFTFPIGGAGRITASYEGNGEYDTSSSYSVRFTLQNTQASY
jgi:hypothetical protein|tara:strand:- start:1111 stop:2067 length:957 start_codon:yes stop_codon:yes gene_type:complete